MDRRNEDPFDAATRVLAGADGTAYDPVAITLHWATALLVLVQFLLSQTWDLFGRPTHQALVVTHMSFGILLAMVIVARLVWRLTPGHQMPSIVAGWTELASKGLHFLLYALLAAEAGLGFLLRWAGGEAMSFFGLSIPSPFAPLSKAAHHQIGELHENVGWAIVILAAGHAGAALYHHYILRDGVLLRMLPASRRR